MPPLAKKQLFPDFDQFFDARPELRAAYFVGAERCRWASMCASDPFLGW